MTTIQNIIVDQGLTRAEQRKQRLLEAETENAREEAEALKMTEEQREMLLRSFATVKAEFADLDGLYWTQTALRKLQPPHRRVAQVATPSPAVSKNNTYVVLSNSDLASFSPEDTIRISTTTKSRPTIPTISTVTKSTFSLDLPCRHRDGSRSRSPIKGLFPSRSNHMVTENSHSAAIVNVSLDESDIADGDDSPETDDTVNYGLVNHSKQGVISKGRVQPPGPPGLSPAPTYEHALIIPPSGGSHATVITSKDFPDTPKRTLLFPSKEHELPKTLVPLPHRDAPSPPSPISAPSSIINSLTARPTSALQPSYTAKAARTRLQSLLHDVHRPAAPPGIIFRPIGSSVTHTPLELPSILTSTTSTSSTTCDDDQTPRPSPITENGSSSIPWIQSSD